MYVDTFPTTRLEENGYELTVPPPPRGADEYNRQLVAEADAILRAAGDRISVDGTLYQGKRPMRYVEPFEWELLSAAGELPEEIGTRWGDPAEVEQLIADVTEICRLTPKEQDLVRAIVEGSVWRPSSGGYGTMGVQLGKSASSVRDMWYRLKPRLVEEWAGERPEAVYGHLRASKEGSTGAHISGSESSITHRRVTEDEKRVKRSCAPTESVLG